MQMSTWKFLLTVKEWDIILTFRQIEQGEKCTKIERDQK